jgi:hypothetical protein
MARRLVTRSLVFSRRAFETRFDVLGLGRPFFESLVFTFWVIILHHVLQISWLPATGELEDSRNRA